MIVNEPPKRKDGKSEFKQLVNYIVDKFDRDRERPGFGQLVNYIAADHEANHAINPGGEEKTLALATHRVTSVHTAAQEMRATAAKSRSNDPVIHWIISWPEHERPTTDQILTAARKLLEKVGLGDHQYVLAVHGNTDNLHCHISVNRVHPDTYRSHRLGWRFDAMHKAAREIELEMGFHHDNGIFVIGIDEAGKKRIVRNPDFKLGGEPEHSTESHIVDLSAKARDRLVWSSAGELLRYTKTYVLDDLNQAVAGAKNWQDITDALDKHGLQLIDTGGGYQIAVPPAPDQPHIKLALSKVARHIKKPDLESRLGKLPSSDALKTPTPASAVANTIQPRNGENHGPVSAPNSNYGSRSNKSRHCQSPSGTPAAGRLRVPDLSELPLVQNQPTGHKMLLSHDVRPQLDQRGGEQDPAVRRNPDQNDGRIGQGSTSPHTIALDLPKRDPEARARRREERAAVRRLLVEQYRQDFAGIDLAGRQIDSRIQLLRAQQKRDIAALRQHFSKLKSSISIDKKLTTIGKRTMHSLLAAQHNDALTELKVRQTAELASLRQLKRKRCTWREWVEEQARAGNEAAIKALRGIVYQQGRETASGRKLHGLHQTSSHLAASELADLPDHEQADPAIRPRKYLNQQTAYDDLIITPVATRLTPLVSNNGNVAFHDRDDAHHVFTDRGNKLSFDRRTVSDEDLRAALLHAAAKYGGRITLTGSDPVFKTRMLRMATELNLVVLNPDLRPLQQAIREQGKNARDQARIKRRQQRQAEPAQQATSRQFDRSR